ncbi:MAG: silP, partial [Acidobacteria bacterium]|nr:silP [Acidobacteriota bacterium]
MKDPVCNMDVQPETAAAQEQHEGQTYYFCGKGCAEKFRANPKQYLASSPKARGLVQLGSREVKPKPPGREHTCPMHPEILQPGPGACPKCGMSLEPVAPAPPQSKTEYTCPMHPEIVRPGPGSCPICGMALEPRTVSAEEEEDPELKSMTRRFWAGVILTLPILFSAMGSHLPGISPEHWLPHSAWVWIELALATPVVVWGGWPFFVRGWQSLVNRSLNMFTLIGLGVGVAYGYSIVATVFPNLFLPSFRST